jgi:ribosomal protein L32
MTTPNCFLDDGTCYHPAFMTPGKWGKVRSRISMNGRRLKVIDARVCQTQAVMDIRHHSMPVCFTDNDGKTFAPVNYFSAGCNSSGRRKSAAGQRV